LREPSTQNSILLTEPPFAVAVQTTFPDSVDPLAMLEPTLNALEAPCAAATIGSVSKLTKSRASELRDLIFPLLGRGGRSLDTNRARVSDSMPPVWGMPTLHLGVYSFEAPPNEGGVGQAHTLTYAGDGIH
jgi:hypothetical protein